MKLTDISPVSSDVLNTKMQAKLGWNIKTENLKVNDAVAMLESVSNKLTAVRNSNKAHVSEKDANYTGMLMAQQVLESFISEKAKNPYAIGMASAMKTTGDKPPLKKSTINKAHKIAKGIDESSTQSVYRVGGYYTKNGDDKPVTLKVNASSENEAKEKASAQLSVDHKNYRATTVTKLNDKGIAKNESVENAIRRMINEDEVTQAQSVMAAKDMVDSIQGMLEDISKMVNEQLPPLTDSIRSNIGDQQAQAFSAAATETLNSLLSQVQAARESVNNAVLGLTGAAPMPVETPDMGADLDTDMGAEEPADEFGASDAAAGGELPLGREKRI
jgi:hypothetical protein